MRYVDGGHVAAAILKQRDIRYVSTTYTHAYKSYGVYTFIPKHNNYFFIIVVTFSVP